jgi:hypothetical protein
MGFERGNTECACGERDLPGELGLGSPFED